MPIVPDELARILFPNRIQAMVTNCLNPIDRLFLRRKSIPDRAMEHRRKPSSLEEIPQRNARASISVAEDSEVLPRLDALLPEVALISPSGLKPGDVLGSYRLIRMLGSGGMGVVYEAMREDAEIRMRVAIKVLHPELCTSDFLYQMRQEASKLARLRHPNIARLLDWKLDQDQIPYCVLEYIDGEPVTAWCERHGLSLAARLRLFLDVCTPVSFAHRNWIAHLDLKPRNIFVKDSGEVRLLDFGLARTLERDTADHDDVSVRGFSPPYASPEQIRGDPISVQSDVYSLGMILRELISVPAEQSGKGASCAPVPCELEAIMARASAADPEQRYGSVSELQKDVRSYLAYRPVSVMPPAPIYIFRKFCRRNLRPLLVAISLIIAIAAGLTTWQMRRRAEREHADADRLRQAVYQLSTTLLFPMEDELRNLPGATPTRMLAVHTGLQYLQNLSAGAEKDPEIAIQVAKAYTKLGDIQGNPSNPNLGDEDGAKASYDAARRLLASSRMIDGRYAYALVLVHEGDLIYVEGNQSQAGKMYQQSIDVFRDLIKSGAEETRFREGLESALIDMGDVESGNDREKARKDYSDAVALAERILERRPDDSNNQRSLARCLSRLGELEWEAGNWKPAYDAYRSSLDVYDRLLHAQPDNIKVRHSWIAGAHNLGDVDEHLGRESEAIDLYRRAEELAAADERLDPHDAFAMRDDQVSYSNLTRAFLQMGNLEKAKQSCLHELVLAKKLWNLNPNDAMTNDDLAGSEQHLATIQARQHQYGSALASQRDALRILRSNVARNRSAENLVEEMDGLLGLADYSLDLAQAGPAAGAAKRTAVQSFTELLGLESDLRPDNAEDRDRARKIREIKARLYLKRNSAVPEVHPPA